MPQHQLPFSTPQTFTSQKPPEPQYYYFRGYKKRMSELNKTKMLKTKRLRDKEQKVLRYGEDEEFVQLEADIDIQGKEDRVNSQRRVKSQFQIMKFNPDDKMQKMQKMRRNKSSTDNHSLMIRTSRMQIPPLEPNRLTNNLPKPQLSTSLAPSLQQPTMTKFFSKNLHQRMNEYLNMVVAKSSHDHSEKVKKVREEQQKLVNGQKIYKEKETKIFMKNKFLRELKTRTNLNKKHLNASANEHNNESDGFTSRQNPSTSRTQKQPHSHREFSHSRMESHQNGSIHNHSSGLGKMAEGEELINFASEVLSRSMKIHVSKSRAKQNSAKKLNCSVQVAGRKG